MPTSAESTLTKSSGEFRSVGNFRFPRSQRVLPQWNRHGFGVGTGMGEVPGYTRRSGSRSPDIILTEEFEILWDSLTDATKRGDFFDVQSILRQFQKESLGDSVEIQESLRGIVERRDTDGRSLIDMAIKGGHNRLVRLFNNILGGRVELFHPSINISCRPVQLRRSYEQLARSPAPTSGSGNLFACVRPRPTRSAVERSIKPRPALNSSLADRPPTRQDDPDKKKRARSRESDFGPWKEKRSVTAAARMSRPRPRRSPSLNASRHRKRAATRALFQRVGAPADLEMRNMLLNESNAKRMRMKGIHSHIPLAFQPMYQKAFRIPPNRSLSRSQQTNAMCRLALKSQERTNFEYQNGSDTTKSSKSNFPPHLDSFDAAGKYRKQAHFEKSGIDEGERTEILENVQTTYDKVVPMHRIPASEV
eukprot:717627_1